MATDGPISSSVPQNFSPQFIGPETSNILSVFSKAAALTAMFRDTLTRHFASADLIEATELKRYIWTPADSSPILIEPITKWAPRTTQARPAIIIKRRTYTNHRVGLGGERHMFPSAERDGSVRYTTFWLGSTTFFCIAGTGAQVEALATEVHREVHHFGSTLVDEVFVHRMGVVEVGEIAMLDEWEEHFVIPVTAGYAFEDSWKILVQAPLLNRVALSTFVDNV